MACWAGIDVGAERKGFHLTAVDERGVVDGPARLGLEAVVARVRELGPAVVALDSPRTYAAPGATRREAERLFAAARICGIRWTPDEATVRAARAAGSSYYDWIVHGLQLYAALERAGLDGRIVECFPTASWAVWAGPRRGGRAAWTRAGLASLGLPGLPPRTLSQDDRDAVAAALTARLVSQGGARVFGGELVVPIRRP